MNLLSSRSGRLVWCLLLVVGFTLTCKKTINWDELNPSTIEENLALLANAEQIYLNRLNAGDISAAAREAQTILQDAPGVTAVIISPDSTVWAYFSNGLIAGICENTSGTNGNHTRKNPSPLTEQPTGIAGGAVGTGPQILVPFADELPGTAISAAAIMRKCQQFYMLHGVRLTQNSEVTIQKVKSLLDDARSLLFWSGHGTLVSPAPGDAPVAGLLTGRGYNRREMANLIAGDFRNYLRNGQNQALLAFSIHDATFYPVILPAFISQYGRFENSEPGWKTMVYISACFSAYQANPQLEQAFRNAGVDLFAGYDWAVTDDFSSELDTTFLGAMIDSCLAPEALAQLPAVTDPSELFGRHAAFRISGDTLVMLRHILDARCDGIQLRSAMVAATGGARANIQAAVTAPDESEPTAQITVGFPGAPGQYDIQFTDDALLCFFDNRNARVYWAVSGYIGVGGTIAIDRYNSELVSGRFSGVLGYWTPGMNPQTDPPTATINLTDGAIKHTGWRIDD